ncbi:hypothetical protein OS493_001819 [Desmophyllum pertusum]|uniref:ShKT domain-containing protein n=1 Tax=Desmophyllum pertusum TaxID=174260 RepID=A0A9X0CTL1_9CNID|nr:hypothetical protein OS493_001819 [Desmophyllum pertusum]
MSDPSAHHVRADDESRGPVAWYKPQQDETLYDTGKCVDRFSSCQRFVGNGECKEEMHKAWMKAKCRKSCGFCEVNCWDTKYGCCPDGKSAADGPLKAGCGVKLCIDLRDCGKVKDECDSVSLAPLRKAWLRTNCAYTCRMCKAASPKGDCESRQPLYGCCWNGDEATGRNGQGCIPCEDTYKRACKLFADCASPFYMRRRFVDQHCPRTCGRCGECADKQKTSKCEEWERQNLCTSSAGWKDYMAENCAKTCHFC